MAIKTNKTTQAASEQVKETNKYDEQVDNKPAVADASVALAPSDRPKEARQPKVGTAKTTTTKKAGKEVVSETTETENVAATETKEAVAEAKPKTAAKKADKKVEAVAETSDKPSVATVPVHLDPQGVATVSVSGSRTVNLGNFESAKIEVQLSLPTALVDINKTHDFAIGWVEAKLDSSLPAKSVATPAPNRTVIHGSNEAVANASTRPPATKTSTVATEAVTQVTETQKSSTASARPASSLPKTETTPAETQVGDTGTRVAADGEVLDPAYDPNVEWAENL